MVDEARSNGVVVVDVVGGRAKSTRVKVRQAGLAVTPRLASEAIRLAFIHGTRGGCQEPGRGGREGVISSVARGPVAARYAPKKKRCNTIEGADAVREERYGRARERTEGEGERNELRE